MYQSVVLKIAQNVKDLPQSVILVDQGENNFYTYKSFDEFARRVAGKLHRMNVGRRDFVTIELPRNKEYVAAMYAVWLVGAAFAPLSPAYPQDRLEYIRKDCNAKAVIDEKFLRGIENEQPYEQTAAPQPQDPALLIYTSGSTGKPKGVLHSHASINDSVIRYSEYTPAPEGFRAALGAPFTFIASVQGIFVPLYCSTTSYLMPFEAMRDPVLLADYIYENKINRVFISPKMLRVFKQKGNYLKTVLTGSERVSNIYTDEFDTVVMYGQTESAAVMAFKIDKKYDNTPIGKPFGNVRTHILDENGNESDEGELCLAGIFADGYLNLPEQTAKTFTPNPFRQQDGFDKLLHTGDIVRKDEQGNIIFLNRKDWMVKINGQRVEPGEIEAIIKNAPGVADAAIKDFKNQYGQVYLVAYYVGNESVDPQDIKSTIAKKLPPYMIPAFFVKLDKLPVNANGKLDRNALIAPEAGNFKTEYAAPETDMQKALCAAFEKVLGVENVGADDDFFAMGGDSIKCAMVSAECDIFKISTADIFEGKTPRMIERLMIKKAQKKKITKKEQSIRVYPLTPSERGMYLEQKLNERSTVYNLNIAAIIKGSDMQTVENALNQVFKAHEAFHSYYGEQNGLPVRIVSDKLPCIEKKTAACREDVLKIVDESAVVPFDLNAGIPVRAAVYQVGSESLIVHIEIHHIAFDGGSAKTFAAELTDGLNGLGVSPAEIDLSDIFDLDMGEKYEKGMAYYKQMFEDGVPVNEMPVRGSRPKVHPLSDRQINFDYDNNQLKVIDKAARLYSVTEFELLFSVVAMTLGKYTSSEDVVLGIPANMRPDGGENLIGMFVNTAPVRIRPVRSMEIADYLASVSRSVRNATHGAYLPFEDVVGQFVKQRDESRSPMFDVSVNYMWNPPAYNKDGLTVELYSPLQKMGRDIGFVFRKSEKGLHCMVQYSSELFEDQVIENFVGQVKHTLEMLENSSLKTVREVLALPPLQAQKLEELSVQARSDVSPQLLHKLFEQSAKENADKTALIAKDRTMTYRELNESANIVANELISKGVGTGDSIVLLLPRESCFFSCMFGVNKAGAAFIPCDPQYPAERINSIIEDSEAAFIITTKDKFSEHKHHNVIDVEDILKGTNTADPDVQMSSGELSYMIYTSGSTGKPKGVMLRHKGICSYLMPHPANIHIHCLKNNVENYLSVTTISFDMSFKEHTAALCNGKTLIFAAEDEMNDPRALAELMEKYNADCINATPSRLRQYLQYQPFRERIAKCKMVMSGGEGYPISLRDEIKKCSPDIRIFNTYGPTEITVSCNAAELTDAQYVTVGRPLLNYTEYIVDKFGDIAPYGVIGELYVGGMGVAKGYKNLPEKTAQAFVEFGGQRMYRSGDHAKMDKDGNVMILGRLDDQVKLRGLRIELGEIQGLIAAQPHIKQAAVVIKKLGGQDNLCAYFTADTEIDIAALRDELKKSLTHYMVPTAYLQLNEMPITPNGKTDTKRLPEPVSLSATEYCAPVNDTEKFFCDAFAKALDLERVGVLDDFFEIGGTSLIVTSVVLAASEKGFEITYGDVFKHTTPRALAQLFKDGEVNDTDKLFDFDDYDYTKINELLKGNTVDAFLSGEQRDVGNILITGATGYMGAHLLAEYLRSEKGTAYCLIRKGRFDTAKERLENMMFYYFGTDLEQAVDERVQVFDGDVVNYAGFERFESMPVDTVFNCAANVKHFSSGTDIEDINVGGAVNCIRLCRKLGARLIHFSTVSVSGTTDDVSKLSRAELDEQSLYFGQTLDNKYTSSKLMGERMVLEAAADGLDAKVIRVGTLAARESDGEFQINFLTNNFMGRLRSYALLGCFPYGMIENQVCMGPIDRSCEAFLKLSRTPQACCVFNAVNNHTLPLGDIIRQMNENGMDVKFVEYDLFTQALNKAQQDPEKAAILSSMTAYMNTAHGKKITALPCKAHYTTQILARLGFFWNQSNEKYVNDFINVLRGFRFFNKNNLKR